MFIAQLDAAIDAGPASANHLAELSRRIWQAWSAGHTSDDEAQAAAQRIAKRSSATVRNGGSGPTGGGPDNAPAGFSVARVTLPKRRNQQSPDKAASIARRRRLAASGGVPPHIAEHFTVSEQAAVRIVLGAIQRTGT